MTFTTAKNRLEELQRKMNRQETAATNKFESQHFKMTRTKDAIEILGTLINEAILELEIANRETRIDARLGEASGRDDETAFAGLAVRIRQKIEALQALKAQYENEYTGRVVAGEVQEVVEDRQAHQALIAEERDYIDRYNRLTHLMDQPEPFPGAHKCIINILFLVKEAKKSQEVSNYNLVEVMDLAYLRATNQMTSPQYDDGLQAIHQASSVKMKLLGAVLLALGIALTASALFFAPAMITAATVSVGAIEAAIAATGIVSGALSAAGGYCFFNQTNTMRLTQDTKAALTSHFDEEYHYAAAPGV